MRVLVLVFLFLTTILSARDSVVVSFSGQVAAWQTTKLTDPLLWYSGGRFVPELKAELTGSTVSMLDLEASFNANGTINWNEGADPQVFTQLKPYRMWMRYSAQQWELRAGLQKINFGSAKMIRPLMWFDGMDIRDPLQLTDGVYGLLGRYYFASNATIWAWGLTANHRPKGYEMAGTARWKPEVGGRVQLPFGPGEIALSYHHRRVNPAVNLLSVELAEASLPEHRLGIDGKWDFEVGIWVEASLVALGSSAAHPTILPARTDMVTAGLDYTIQVGNGLGATLEYFRYHAGDRFFSDGVTANMVATMFTYPLSMMDNLSLMVFYIPASSQSYWMNYLSWSRTYDNLSVYLIGFVNPDNYSLPGMSVTSSGQFAGKGLQLMLSYNF